MEPDYRAMATDLLNSGMGDSGRLRFILECIAKNKPLYRTDRIFLESLSKILESKIQKLQNNTQKTRKPRRVATEALGKESKPKVVAEPTMAPKTAKPKVVAEPTMAPKTAKPKVVAVEKESKPKVTAETPKTTKQVIGDVGAGKDNNKSRTLISDEYLDKHIDQIDDKRNPNRVPEEPVRKRKKSFLGRLFSK